MSATSNRSSRRLRGPVLGVAALAVAGAGAYALVRWRQAESPAEHQVLVNRYCLDCHSAAERAGELSLEGVNLAQIGQHAEIGEAVVRKLRVAMMPPADAPQPDASQRAALVSWLERRLDRAAAESPDPGPSLVRRLNRAEYANAARDLLQLEIDATALLPPDDSAYGFDNIADALNTSPAHVEQYLSAAGKIAALAVGDPDSGPAAQTFRIRQDASQDIPVVGMPLGTVVELRFPTASAASVMLRISSVKSSVPPIVARCTRSPSTAISNSCGSSRPFIAPRLDLK